MLLSACRRACQRYSAVAARSFSSPLLRSGARQDGFVATSCPFRASDEAAGAVVRRYNNRVPNRHPGRTKRKAPQRKSKKTTSAPVSGSHPGQTPRPVMALVGDNTIVASYGMSAVLAAVVPCERSADAVQCRAAGQSGTLDTGCGARRHWIPIWISCGRFPIQALRPGCSGPAPAAAGCCEARDPTRLRGS